ncbi:MAG: hypothetical protein JW994_02830 [Candidatus Omnitrophica bacterium]|nr:hypothetical protein [Candidatus Omnitrophota bacterium]
MRYTLIIQFISLSLYVVFAGFCFCDGFKIRIARKIIWFTVFLAISVCVLKIKGDFDLAYILPLPTALAIIFCGYGKTKSKGRLR